MRYIFVLIMAASAVMAICAGQVSAAERFGAFAVFDSLKDAILLDGEITSKTPGDLKRALAARPEASIVVLGSSGGLVPAALKLASEVRRLGLSTAIPSGFGCYSACAYVYFAGVEHVVKGELGVHRLSTGTTADGASTLAYFDDVRRDLARYNIPEPVLQRMVTTPPTGIYVFSSREISQYALNRTKGAGSLTAQIAAR